MFKLKFFSLQWKEHLPLALILFFAGIVRFVGLDYGLPLWLMGDEVSHIFGALKMMELKTILPVLHVNEFAGVFYYTPYLSYFYILPFTLVAGLKFLFFSGTFEQFKNYLMADPSVFFIAARVTSAFFGLATVYFVYAAAWQMFQKKKVALFSAFFIAFSYLSVSYSHWARHWTIITLLYAVGIYILAHRGLSVSKRFILIAVLIGIGVGFNVQMIILGTLVFIWFFVFDYQPTNKLWRQKWIWQAIGLFFLFFGFAFILWPKGYDYFLSVGNVNLTGASINSTNPLSFCWFYILNLVYTEPTLMLFVLLGLLIMCFTKRRSATIIIVFSLLYLLFFYLFFSHVDRFILPLYPFLAISAGFGLSFILDHMPIKLLRLVLVVAVCIFLTIPTLRFDYLLLKNDTRVRAIDWVKINVSEDAKVLVLAPLMRLPATPEALTEQMKIDSKSLRTTDRAEANLVGVSAPSRRFNVLNLYNVENGVFLSNLNEFIKKNSYQYVIYSPFFARGKGVTFLDNLYGERIKFNGSWNFLLSGGHERMPDGFGEGWKELFYSHSFGPDIVVLKL